MEHCLNTVIIGIFRYDARRAAGRLFTTRQTYAVRLWQAFVSMYWDGPDHPTSFNSASNSVSVSGNIHPSES